jgi:hypothetical protein
VSNFQINFKVDIFFPKKPHLMGRIAVFFVKPNLQLRIPFENSDRVDTTFLDFG